MIRILLTNDDGIDAAGISAMEIALKKRPDVEYWTVAPDGQRSACSHSMTLGSPIHVEQLSARRFMHSGTVADGVYWALVHLLVENKPNIVVSGINCGANLAEDVIYSGTVAGAREAVLRNVHGLAVSLVDGSDFTYAAPNVAALAVRLAKQTNANARLFNVNYPVGEFEGPFLCELGTRPYQPLVSKVSPKGFRDGFLLGGPPVKDVPRRAGTDVALIEAQKASITPLLMNQTAPSLWDDEQVSFFKEQEES